MAKISLIFFRKIIEKLIRYIPPLLMMKRIYHLLNTTSPLIVCTRLLYNVQILDYLYGGLRS